MRATRSGLIALFVLSACAALVPAQASAQKRQRDLITREEILNSAHQSQDLFQLIRSLRPHFLAPPRGVRTLGGGQMQPASLYVDGVRVGELDGLRVIIAGTVEEVRYLDPSRAENEYGPQGRGGAVVVKLFKGAKRDTIPPLILRG